MIKVKLYAFVNSRKKYEAQFNGYNIPACPSAKIGNPAEEFGHQSGRMPLFKESNEYFRNGIF